LKREVPIALTALCGVFLFGGYFFKIPFLTTGGVELQNWGIIIAAFAFAMAATNLSRIHVARIAKGGSEAVFSVILLCGLGVTLASGIFGGTTSKPFDFVFRGIMTPLAAAFYAMTAFHLASASYRAFRAKSAQATALLVTGVLLMIGRAPIGEVIWGKFPAIAQWIMSYVNLAGSRGIQMSTAVGTVGLALRILTGIDRSHLGSMD